MAKSKFKQIENLVKKYDGKISFDTWGGEERSEFYRFLVDKFKEKGLNYFRTGKHAYIVSFTNGSSGMGGMDMGSPDSVTVEKVRKYKG